jgi:transcriptional regulator with XRE-family HTH domain
MNSKKQLIYPKYQKNLETMGENIKLARKRRKLTGIQVAERAGIDRGTLREIERGNPGVSLGAYFNVLRALNLHDDFLKIAADDEFGKKLQDLTLLSSRTNRDKND